jgi:calnexin
LTGEYEEKHLTTPPVARVTKVTHLYTLVVNPDNTFYISIDGDRVKNGTLHDDFSPAVNPVAEINDPDDTKPTDWVDDARIPDPEALKPEDWDEDAPFEIVDEEATIPEDWLVDEPATVPDPEAQKPEDWDDEEDGDWIAPTIPNPKCDEASGCGPWEKPMKTNPEYKGKWTAPWIDNPAFKGIWEPKKIPNPDYFNDEHPANFEPIGAIGFEIWTMQNNILFDNIYIGHSVEDAETLKKATYDVKVEVEKEEEKKDFPHPQPEKKTPKSPMDLDFMEDPVLYIKEKLALFIDLASRDPVQAVKFLPDVAGGIAAVVITVLALLAGIVSLATGSSAAPKAKEAAKKAGEKVSEVASDAKDAVASATGTDKPAATKRTTRSG